MFSPFEELEYIADYLPEEGEAVLISREAGELVCKPYSNDDLRDGVDDAELYGFLVQANERVHSASTFPIWVTVLVLFWMAVALHGVLGVAWDRWYIVPGLAIPMVMGTASWIQHRQRRVFQQEIAPQLSRELSRRGIRPYALVAGVRQHGELRSIFEELVSWIPARVPSRPHRERL
ncbi:hypothetical protein SH661x_003046 [Planctomicrobium sp. SH661]|uniref:hypothetical protein n=1 Tax=Planctomicrobium sp. SH661 TaxID=3448124 RepID=UPI003F5B3110